MRSFAGIVAEEGGSPDASLLRHLGAAIRLPASTSAVLRLDQCCGLAVVAHRGDAGGALIARDGEAWLAGTIRLDDRRSLARDLGDFTPSASDCELVLRAWRRRGSGVVVRLFGDYSFVVWDGTARELLCVRDRFGVRPFYYAQVGRSLAFSDSLAAILAHPGTNVGELDDGAVADYLTHGVSRDSAATIFARVRRLPPGHLILHRPGGEIIVRQYWIPDEPPDEPNVPRPRDDLPARLESVLEDAIRDRVTGANAMVFMSGGLDSTTIAALAHEALPHLPLTAGTSVYRTRIDDVEETYASEAARSIGIPIHFFPLDEYSPLGALETGCWLPEPGPLLMAPMTRAIYAFAATVAPVAFHGHPADALLLGEFAPFLMGMLRRGELLRFAAALISYTRTRRRPPYFVVRHLMGAEVREPQAAALPDWFDRSFVRRLDARPLQSQADSANRGWRPRAIAALRSPIWSSYFEWAHPLMTGAAIELAYPWCDLRVVDLLLAAEPIPALVDKHVLREILRGRISDTVRRRGKTPLRGDPWTVSPAPDPLLRIDAATPYIDGSRFAEACRAAGGLADRTLRAVALEYWLRELPGRVRLARRRTRLSAQTECYHLVMSPGDKQRQPADGGRGAGPVKRPWIPPKLETFGTIAELTRGAGSHNNFDGGHPPGQNKSRL